MNFGNSLVLSNHQLTTRFGDVVSIEIKGDNNPLCILRQAAIRKEELEMRQRYGYSAVMFIIHSEDHELPQHVCDTLLATTFDVKDKEVIFVSTGYSQFPTAIVGHSNTITIMKTACQFKLDYNLRENDKEILEMFAVLNNLTVTHQKIK